MSLLEAPVARDPAGERTLPGWGAMIGAACLPALASYLAAGAVVTALSAAAGADGSPAWLARAAAMTWLVAHHVPLTIDGAPLGVLPLLPTLLVGVLVARGAARLATRSGIHRPAEAGWVSGTFAGTHGVLGAVLALTATPAAVTADPALAALGCALVAGVSAGIGLTGPCGLFSAALRQAPSWVRPGVEAGLWGLAVLLTAGLATVVLALGVSAPAVVQVSGSDVGSALGLTALSLGYLPNAAIAGVSWLAGPGFSIGALWSSPLAGHTAPLPAFPLLAAVPQGQVQAWWCVALAVPLLVGAAVGRRCVPAADELPRRLRVLVPAAAVPAAGSALLGALAGGQLGAAAFDPVNIPFGTLMLAVLAATLVGGSAAALLVPSTAREAPGTHPEPAASTPAKATASPVTDADHDTAAPDEEGGLQ